MANKGKKKTMKMKKTKAPAKVSKTSRGNKQYAVTATPGPVRTLVTKQKKMALHHAVCSILDPFCVHAKSAKYPDGNGTGAIPFQSRTIQNITSLGALASNVWFIHGRPVNNILSAFAKPAGTSWSLNGTYITNFDAKIRDFAKKMRIVSWGVIVRCAVNAGTAQGNLIISKLSSPPDKAATGLGVAVMRGNEVVTVPIYAGMEVCVVSAPLGSSARAFIEYPKTPDDTINYEQHWETIKLELYNVVTNNDVNMCSCELYYNVEIQLDEEDSTLAQVVPRANPLPQPKVVAAATHALGNMPNILEGGVEKMGQSILSHVENSLTTIMSEGLAFLGL